MQYCFYLWTHQSLEFAHSYYGSKLNYFFSVIREIKMIYHHRLFLMLFHVKNLAGLACQLNSFHCYVCSLCYFIYSFKVNTFQICPKSRSMVVAHWSRILCILDVRIQYPYLQGTLLLCPHSLVCLEKIAHLIFV